MKNLLVLILVLCVISGSCLAYDFPPPEDTPCEFVHIAYVFYDSERGELFGWAEIPGSDPFFARVTFFCPNNFNFVVVIPMDCAGFFTLDILVNATSAAVCIMNTPCVLNPECGIVYDSAPVQIL